MNHNEKSVSKTPLSRKFDTQKLVVIAVLIILFTVFSLLSPPFRSYSTVITLLSYSYYIAFMAIGVTFALITGGVDLSLGTGMICYGLIGGYLIVEKGMPVGVGMLATVLVAVLFGLFNGTLIAVLDIPPFIATLATMMITRGIGSVVVGGMSVTWPQAASAQGWLLYLGSAERADHVLHPKQDQARPIHHCYRQQQGGDSSLRRQGCEIPYRSLRDCWFLHGPRFSGICSYLPGAVTGYRRWPRA